MNFCARLINSMASALGRNMHKNSASNQDETLYSNTGYCPVCCSNTTFQSLKPWLRDYYVCQKCGSVPRERQLFKHITLLAGDLSNKKVCEFGFSNEHVKQKTNCYTGSQYFPNLPFGAIVNGVRNENMEKLTFESESFDLVVHSDILEHLFNPLEAVKETVRILKKNGSCIFVFPIYKHLKKSIKMAEIDTNGKISYNVLPPEYHGNPVDEKGALVTWHYGHDILSTMEDYVKRSYNVEFASHSNIDKFLGIEGEFLDVVIINKL